MLRGVAAYKGGLTKGEFMTLFAIRSSAANELPRTSHKRHGGGSYYLYDKSAVDAALTDGGMDGWRRRHAARAHNPLADVLWLSSTPRCFRQAHELEEHLHRRARVQRVKG